MGTCGNVIIKIYGTRFIKNNKFYLTLGSTFAEVLKGTIIIIIIIIIIDITDLCFYICAVTLFQAHLEVCPKFPFTCPQKCGMILLRETVGSTFCNC